MRKSPHSLERFIARRELIAERNEVIRARFLDLKSMYPKMRKDWLLEKMVREFWLDVGTLRNIVQGFDFHKQASLFE